MIKAVLFFLNYIGVFVSALYPYDVLNLNSNFVLDTCISKSSESTTDAKVITYPTLETYSDHSAFYISSSAVVMQTDLTYCTATTSTSKNPRTELKDNYKFSSFNLTTHKMTVTLDVTSWLSKSDNGNNEIVIGQIKGTIGNYIEIISYKSGYVYLRMWSNFATETYTTYTVATSWNGDMITYVLSAQNGYITLSWNGSEVLNVASSGDGESGETYIFSAGCYCQTGTGSSDHGVKPNIASTGPYAGDNYSTFGTCSVTMYALSTYHSDLS